MLSILGLDSGYTVKYRPSPFEDPFGWALGNSLRQRALYNLISFLYAFEVLKEPKF